MYLPSCGITIPGAVPVFLKLLSFFINLRSLLFKYGTGDQVFFIKKNIFDNIDGFPKFELMEDIKLCSKLKKVSKPLISEIYIKTSARKWEKNGFLRFPA